MFTSVKISKEDGPKRYIKKKKQVMEEKPYIEFISQFNCLANADRPDLPFTA